MKRYFVDFKISEIRDYSEVEMIRASYLSFSDTRMLDLVIPRSFAKIFVYQ